MSEANAATPAENLNGTTTPPPAATPANNATEGETVVLPKSTVEQLQRDAARAATNQSKADRYDKIVGKGGGHFRPVTPATPLTEDEQKSAAEAEDRKAERGLLGLAADPAYREALDADPTLRTLLTTNPLALLPAYAPDALDADDAIALVKDALAVKVNAIKASKAPVVPATPPATTPETPPAGGVNPPAATTPDAQYEEARKRPNTEHALAGMIGAGLRKLGGK